MIVKKVNNKKRLKLGNILVILILIFAVSIFIFFGWLIYKDTRPINSQNTQKNTLDTTPINNEEVASEAPEPEYDAKKIESAVDGWVSSLKKGSEASLVVLSSEGDFIAGSNPDQIFFAASLYKLFVAYEGYKLIDSNNYDPSKIYLDTKTREDCLDLMIRESNSPCGEKMMQELGREELTKKVQKYGLKNTSLLGITTTARDTAKFLTRLEQQKDLEEKATKSYFDSMLRQPEIYRRGIPSGFSNNVKVYNKVGWNENLEWHDASIVEINNERFIVAVLTTKVGSAKVSEFSKVLEAAIK